MFAERAIHRYLQSMDDYVTVLTDNSEREASYFRLTGEPQTRIEMGLAHEKSDQTDVALIAYRERLRLLARSGNYRGSTSLKRMRPDGSWEPLILASD